MADSEKQHISPSHYEIAEIIQNQHNLIVATRKDRQTCHSYSIHHLISVLKHPIPFMEYPIRIVRNAGHYMHIMSLLCPMKGDIITTKYLRVEILAHEQYFLLITHIPYFMRLCDIYLTNFCMQRQLPSVHRRESGRNIGD
jgi:hypothetical protein